ncbi:formylglycine-generating enzyme family protein [Bacillus sp. SL00103]
MYQSYCDETGQSYPESLTNQELGGGKDHPAWGMEIEEAFSFCQWLSGKLGIDVSIPTEEEWEYAARGNTRNQYPWGDEFDLLTVIRTNQTSKKTTPVRHYEKGRSLFGLYDMGATSRNGSTQISCVRRRH